MRKLKFGALLITTMLLTACASESDSKATGSSAAAKPVVAQTTAAPTLIPLTAPKKLSVALDGATLVVDWDDVAGATGYECTFKGAKDTLKKADSSFNLKNVSEGTTYELMVRSIRKTAKGEELSDWTSVQYSVPTVNYDDIRYGSAMFLSAAQVEKWAAKNGYKCEKSEKNGVTTVAVHTKDEANSGFFNSAGRILASAIEGFLGGYSEQVADDFSDVDRIVEKYAQSGSLKDMFEDEDAQATQNGKIGALKSALNAAVADTDIYFIYYFSNVAKSCDMSTVYLLQNTRENYRNEQFGKYNQDNQGRYIIPFSYGNGYFEVAQITSNGLKKWAVVGTHD